MRTEEAGIIIFNFNFHEDRGIIWNKKKLQNFFVFLVDKIFLDCVM